MPTINNYQHSGLLLCLLFIFVLLKIPLLNEPFYWDEAWVYAPAIIQMAENGPSLLPNAIDIDFSRGHPLLFHFIGGVFANIFGKTPLVLNTFALLISTCCLLFSFKLGALIFNKTTGLITVGILATNELFFCQSLFVLPEIFLATLVLSSFYYYFLKKSLYLFISLSLLSLTKESALVLIFVLLFTQFLLFLFHKDKFNKGIFIAVISSLAIFGSTFILNKIYHGWYFYPLHTDYIKVELEYIVPRMKRIIGDLISYNHHFLLFIPIALTFLSYHYKNSRLILGLSSFGFFVSFSLFRYFPIALGFANTLLIGLLVTGGFALFKNHKFKFKVYEFYIISLSFTFAYIIFSALNFYTNRYILSLLPLYIIIASWAIVYICNRVRHLDIVFALSLIAFQISKIYIFDQTKSSYSQCYQIMKCHKSIAKFIVENVEDGAPIKVDFLMYHHFKNPNNGYYDHTLKNIKWTMWGGYDYIIYENLIPDYEKHFKYLESKNNFEKIYSCNATPRYKSMIFRKLNPQN